VNFPTIEGYKIVSKIGEGAMSEVFMANNNQGTVVAIKVLRHFFKDRGSYVDRLRKEAQTMSLLRDERIVKCLEVIYTEEGVPALVCEFVNGKNLEEVQKQHKENVDFEANPIVAANIVAEVLLGLEEAHRQGIVHRDLKPENILLTQQGRLKITDFGVAKNLESQEMTVTGLVMGSPAYMSPEQIYGESIDERSDLYALGVMLYYFSTGELPFKGETYGELSQKVLRGKYLAPEKMNPNIHPLLAEIIKKALAKNPEERYQKSYEFRYDLMKWMDELCLPSGQDILSHFFMGESIEFLGRNQIIQTLLIRAKQAKKDRQNQKMNHYLQQVLTLDPGQIEARDLLANRFQVRSGIMFSILFLLGGMFLFFNQKEVITQIPLAFKESLELPIVQKTINKTEFFNGLLSHQRLLSDKVRVKKAAIKKEYKTGVQFYVDEGVDVYVDGEKIEDLSQPYLTTSGSHDVMLVKPGFNPITQKIYVVKYQITKINAK
jgi:serine/threonine protein kinase